MSSVLPGPTSTPTQESQGAYSVCSSAKKRARSPGTPVGRSVKNSSDALPASTSDG